VWLVRTERASAGHGGRVGRWGGGWVGAGMYAAVHEWALERKEGCPAVHGKQLLQCRRLSCNNSGISPTTSSSSSSVVCMLECVWGGGGGGNNMTWSGQQQHQASPAPVHICRLVSLASLLFNVPPHFPPAAAGPTAGPKALTLFAPQTLLLLLLLLPTPAGAGCVPRTRPAPKRWWLSRRARRMHGGGQQLKLRTGAAWWACCARSAARST
jgi:hypothetical protein